MVKDCDAVASSEVHRVLDLLGVGVRRFRRIGEHVAKEGNANWHVWTAGSQRSVLRRYHSWTTPEDLEYEHTVLRFLVAAGWKAPAPLAGPLEHQGRWYCLTSYVLGRARKKATAAERHQRGRDLAKLQMALRPLSGTIGQRPRFRALHEAIPAHRDLDWAGGIEALASQSSDLADWAERARAAAIDELQRLGAADLPVTLVHGDFAEWNVHYQRARLVGVVDFAMTHLDSRPSELAIARTYRSPEVIAGYCERLKQLGWPLSELEDAAIEPMNRAFRVDMTAWLLEEGRRLGRFDTDMIIRQLERTEVAGSRRAT